MENTVVLQLEKELNNKFINRQQEIRGLLLALLTNSNIILLGEPGTAKTALVQTISKQVNGKHFQTLLNKTSTAEELFGAYDIKELEEGNYVRKTENTLVDCNVAFVDEVFKCNSEVLNSLLDVMANRQYRNGQALPQPIPTQLLVGASNEMPEGGHDGDLAALWDRFELRYVVENIKTDEDFKELLNIKSRPEPTTTLNLNDIVKIKDEFKEYSYEDVVENIINIKNSLLAEKIKVSDRKWVNCIKYMQANAWLEGRKYISFEDLKVLKHILWQDPAQIEKVSNVINTYSKDLNEEDYKTTLELTSDVISTISYYVDNKKECDDDDFNEIAQKIKYAINKIKDLKKRSISQEKKNNLMDRQKEIAAQLEALKEFRSQE